MEAPETPGPDNIDIPPPPESPEKAARLKRQFAKWLVRGQPHPVAALTNIERRARRFIERLYGIQLNSKQWRRLRKHLDIQLGADGEVLVREQSLPSDGNPDGGHDGGPTPVRGPSL